MFYRKPGLKPTGVRLLDGGCHFLERTVHSSCRQFRHRPAQHQRPSILLAAPCTNARGRSIRQPNSAIPVSFRSIRSQNAPNRSIRQSEQGDPSFVSPQPDRTARADAVQRLTPAPMLLRRLVVRQPDPNTRQFASPNPVHSVTNVRQPAAGEARFILPQIERLAAPRSLIQQPDPSDANFISPNPERVSTRAD